MARGGVPPKPAHLRQRTNKKTSHAYLVMPEDPTVPEIPTPAGREWNILTLEWWEKVWKSPMSEQYIETDIDGLGRLALLVDNFYNSPRPQLLAEIRLQEMRFGLSPLDRSRLQWEITKAEEAERKRKPHEKNENPGLDPREILKTVV